MYHEAIEAMYRVPLKAAENEKRNIDVDDEVPRYCIVGQISKPNTVPTENEDDIGSLPVANKMKNARANDVLCQNFKKVLRTDGTVTVSEVGLQRRKAFIAEKIQIFVPEY